MRYSHAFTKFIVPIPNLEKMVDFYVETFGVHFEMAISVASHREVYP